MVFSQFSAEKEICGLSCDKVTGGQLATAINSTALNPSSVQPVGGIFADIDLNIVKDKLDELIAAFYRAP